MMTMMSVMTMMSAFVVILGNEASSIRFQENHRGPRVAIVSDAVVAPRDEMAGDLPTAKERAIHAAAEVDETDGAEEGRTEMKHSKCNIDSSCGNCVLEERCGFCRSTLVSGDGTASVTISECRPGNEKGPSDRATPCDSWSFLSCASLCKNDCSGHGVCQTDGSCQCTLSYEGDDCSRVLDVHNKIGAMVPIAFVAAVVVVGILIVGPVSEQRCWNEGYTSDDDDDDDAKLEALEESSAEDARASRPLLSKTTLRSRPARG